jgi:hypothetical protein
VTGSLLAHGIGGASDLPIPLSYALSGAAWALTVSFAILAFSWPTSRFRGDDAGRDLPAAVSTVVGSRWTRALLRTLGLALAVYVGWAAVAGQDVAVNPAIGMFYVVVWVAMVPVSLLVGDVWPLLSPVRTLHLGLAWAMRTRPGAGVARYPAWLGYWPAAAGLFAFVWTELVDPDSAFVSTVLTWVLLYAAVMLLGGAVFGTRWFERADPFEVYFGLVARLSPWGWRRTGDGRRVVVRNPLDGLDGVPVDRGLLAVVSVLLGSTAFDSFAASGFWLTRTARPGGLDPQLRDTLVLLGFIAVVAISFALAAMMAPGVDRALRRRLPMLMAHSLVPIVVGYVFAHYLTLLVEYGQAVLAQLSDPLTRGDDYLGTADLGVHYVLSTHPTALALIKVAAIVTGHVLAVVAAHDRAVRVLPARQAVTGQLSMLVVMVGYTTAGLLLLFSA